MVALASDEPNQSKKDTVIRLLKGISLTILSAFFFSITTLIVKYLQNVNATLMALYRYVGIFILSFPLALEANQPLFGFPGTRLWLVLRGLAGGTSVFFRYSALNYISMADSTIIILSMPVFVFVFARIFLKERFGRFHVVSLLMSIVGILLASKIEHIIKEFTQDSSTAVETATVLFNSTINGTDSTVATKPTQSRLFGTIFSLGSTLIGSLVYIIIRKVSEKDFWTATYPLNFFSFRFRM